MSSHGPEKGDNHGGTTASSLIGECLFGGCSEAKGAASVVASIPNLIFCGIFGGGGGSAGHGHGH